MSGTLPYGADGKALDCSDNGGGAFKGSPASTRDPGDLVSFRDTHVGGLLVVVYVVHVSGQAEVGDLHDVVVRHQNVSGRQVSVDALRGEAGGHEELGAEKDLLGRPQTSTLALTFCEARYSIPRATW